MMYTYIPTGIKREFVRFGVDCDQKGYIFWIVRGGTAAIHSSRQTIFGFTHIEGITLGTGEKVAVGASGMSVDRVGEVCDRAREG